MSWDMEQIGACTLYRGDALEVLPTLETIDVIITDPPFTAKTHHGARTNSWKQPNSVRPLLHFDAISLQKLRLILELSCPERWAIATVDYHHCIALEQEAPQGLRFIRFGIWNKTCAAPQFSGDRPAQGWEAIAILHHATHQLRWNGGGTRAVWTYDKIQGTKSIIHPTQKPLPLVLALTKQFSNRQETVLDPFMGSGTTGIACIKLGRSFIGIEIDERYFQMACERITDAYRQGDLFSPAPAPAPRQEALL